MKKKKRKNRICKQFGSRKYIDKRESKKLDLTPLIKVKVLLNETLEVNGIYDSSSNVSLINSRLLKMKKKQTSDISNTNLKTINGVRKADELITVKIKIFNMKNMMDIFVINSKYFNYDFLIGLDCIKIFKLC